MSTRFSHSFLRQAGYWIWLIMLGLSIVFYRERAFFMDAGFQLFNLINEETIQVYHYRFVTGLPQVLPFVLLKFHAPLWLLALVFSVSYILIYLFAYHILVKYLKNDCMGWVLILLFTLISLDSFYHIQSEFYLGLTFLLLAFGIVLRFPQLKEPWQFPVLLPILITVGFSHKLSLIFFLFLWAWFYQHTREVRNWRYGFLLVLFLIIASIKNLFFTNWYEAAKQVDFRNNWAQYFPDLINIPSNFIFLERSLYYYYGLPLMLLVVTVWYLYKKQFLKPALTWVFLIGYLLLYNISDPHSPYRFYAEVTYLPLAIFVAVPFMFDLALSMEKHWWFKWLLIVLIAVRLLTIALNSEVIRAQFHWIERQFDREEAAGHDRLLISSSDVPMDTVLMEWGVPFTTMHLSAMGGSQNAKTILIMPDFDWYQEKMSRDDLFFSPFHKVFRRDSLNTEYYDLKRGTYHLIE